MKPVIQKVTCGGILVHTGKVLIVKRNKNDDSFPGLWEVPSGKKENFEDPSQTAVREFKEEVGIDVKTIRPLTVFVYKVDKDTETRDMTQIDFLVSCENPEVKLSEEHDDFAWITKEEVDSYNISTETKEAILSAFK